MPAPMEEVATKALKLPYKKRAELAHTLIVSLDDPNDTSVETAWDAEIGRRVKEIKNGQAQGRPAVDILAEIRAKYS